MIFQTLLKENILALKESSRIKKNLISTVIAESSRIDKSPSDEFVVKTLKKMIESNISTILLLKENDTRKNLLLEENEIMNSFLPKQLDEKEIENLISENKLISLAQTMSWFKTNYSGKYDGSIVRTIFNSKERVKND